MLRKVVVTMFVDATQYHEAEDTAEGTVNLAVAMLKGETDFPDDREITVECSDSNQSAMREVLLDSLPDTVRDIEHSPSSNRRWHEGVRQHEVPRKESDV